MKLLYSLHKYDVFLFEYLINARIHRYLAIAARYISKTGDGHLYVFLGLYIYLTQSAESLYLKTLFIAFLIERPVYFCLKKGFKRNRPQQALKNFRSLVTPSDHFSFPSGHTSAAFMVAVICGFFVPSLFIPLIVWASLVGFSRVILGVHFPTDIVVGICLGISVASYCLNQIYI